MTIIIFLYTLLLTQKTHRNILHRNIEIKEESNRVIREDAAAE